MNLHSIYKHLRGTGKSLPALAATLSAQATLLLAACSLAACDNIDEDARFSGPLPFEIRKNVLIEDFTGQNCLNCPLATQTVEEMQTTYGSAHIIPVAIHGGSMSISTAAGGLATAQGNAYVSQWGVVAFPQGMVDRTGGLTEFAAWPALVYQRLQVPASVGILLANTYDAATRQLTIHVSLTGAEDISDGRLVVWLTESGVSARQRQPDGTLDRTYIHRHVFRTVVGSTNEPDLSGEAVSIAAGGQQSLDYTFTIPAEWEAENMDVVAFVHNGSGVLQAEQAPVAGTPATDGEAR